MCDLSVPGCFCRGLGRLVTHVWGHMRTLQGCKAPSRKRCLVSDMWMPPSGALGSVLAGTRAKQYTPTRWMLSMAWKRDGIRVKKGGKAKLSRTSGKFVLSSNPTWTMSFGYPAEN